MHARRLVIAALFSVLIALSAAGCGDNNSGKGNLISPDKPAAPPAQTGASGASAKSGSSSSSSQDKSNTATQLKTGYESCITGAKKIKDKKGSANAVARCKYAYEQAKKVSNNASEAMSTVRANCLMSASTVKDPAARQRATEACSRLPK